jgi:hypothetical protein
MHAWIRRYAEGGLAGPGRLPSAEPVTVQRRASNTGVIMVVGQKIALGRIHAGQIVTVHVAEETMTVDLGGDDTRQFGPGARGAHLGCRGEQRRREDRGAYRRVRHDGRGGELLDAVAGPLVDPSESAEALSTDRRVTCLIEEIRAAALTVIRCRTPSIPMDPTAMNTVRYRKASDRAPGSSRPHPGAGPARPGSGSALPGAGSAQVGASPARAVLDGLNDYFVGKSDRSSELVRRAEASASVPPHGFGRRLQVSPRHADIHARRFAGSRASGLWSGATTLTNRHLRVMA